MSWNVLIYNPKPEEITNFLNTRPADIIVLQETDGAWLDSEPSIAKLYPYQLRAGHGAPDDLVLLSSYPILADSGWDSRNTFSQRDFLLWARLDLGQGQSLRVTTAHPRPPIIGGCLLKLCYNPQARDEQIRKIHQQLAPLLQKDEPLILAGDFNITNQEPAYQEISKGLINLHGSGGGNSWGGKVLWGQRLAIIKIDHIFANDKITPLNSRIDCRWRGSDHCAIFAEFGLK